MVHAPSPGSVLSEITSEVDASDPAVAWAEGQTTTVIGPTMRNGVRKLLARTRPVSSKSDGTAFAADSLKILIIAMNYAPEVSGTAPYTHRMASALARDHEVEVLAGLPHYPEWQLHPGYAGWKRQSVEDGVRVRRLWHVIPRHPNPVSRLLHELTFAARVVTQRVRRPDVVIAVSPPLFGAAAALLVARRLRVPLGLIVQDIYSAGVQELALDQGLGRLAAAWIGCVERYVVERAARITTIHDRFAARLLALSRRPDPDITIIRNWTHLPDSSRSPEQQRELLGWGDRHILLHAGNMGEKQGLENIVEAARDTDRRGLPLTYVLLGDGNQRPGLQRLARGVRSIQFLPSADAKEYSSILRAADVLLVNERVGVVEMSLPSKLTSYCAAAWPILAAVSGDGATSEALARSGAGVLAPPGDPSALNDAALTLINDADRAAELGENGRTFAKEHFGEQTAIERYETWIRELASRTRAIAR